MKDATFHRRLRQLAAAKQRYLTELTACEAEYERRFGTAPGDIDDDDWIDFAHVSGAILAVPTVADVGRSASFHLKIASESPYKLDRRSEDVRE